MSTGKDLARQDDRVRFADSARTVRPGELVVVGRNGETQDRRQVRTQIVLATAGITGAVAVPLALLGAGVFGVVTGVGVTLGLLARGYRSNVRPYLLAQSRMLTGDLDGAEQLLAAVPPSTRKAATLQRGYVSGWVAYGRGQFSTAIGHFESALPFASSQTRQLILVALADALAHVPDVERAKQVRSQFAPPRSELMRMCVASVDLAIAIHEHTEAAFEEATLDEWVRLGLALNHSSHFLAMLAKVIATRGDDDLANHLARESRDRFAWSKLSVVWPELDTWLETRVQPE